jgi:hypothetical protein
MKATIYSHHGQEEFSTQLNLETINQRENEAKNWQICQP